MCPKERKRYWVGPGYGSDVVNCVAYFLNLVLVVSFHRREIEWLCSCAELLTKVCVYFLYLPTDGEEIEKVARCQHTAGCLSLRRVALELSNYGSSEL